MNPYQINISDEVLDDLRDRLVRTRWPDSIHTGDWADGTDLDYLKELCEYWRTDFDWREQERKLNAFDHFTTDIDGLNVHYIHQRSKEPGALPLVITHGWPGSIFEFLKIIGPLVDPVAHGGEASDAFDVICPSIPGYGFSSALTEPGFDIKRAAETIMKLAHKLGLERYGAQGGDWGSAITSWLGELDADRVCGIHLNMLASRPPKGVKNPMEGLTQAEVQYMAQRQQFMKLEIGYRQIQSTKPQTLGYGLNDSPAGLAGWFTEKFRVWTDCGGDIEKSVTKDELLTNITIYWATQTITSSARIYYETRKTRRFRPEGKIEVPTGCALFPAELFLSPRSWAEADYNVTHWTEMPRGGHFAALEEPELLVEDVRAFFRTVR